MIIEENKSLRNFNTFGIDITSHWFSRFSSLEELRELLSSSIADKNKRLILGGGSNLLFTSNFEGLVMRNELKGIELVREDDNHFFVKAAAGENWHQFVLHCLAHNRAGLENLSLIPGCVGASPMQNIGAYGVEIKDVFESLEAFHIKEGIVKSFNAAECLFDYRESIFKRKEKDQWIILNVTFRLLKRPIFQTTYGAIEEELDKLKIEKLTIQDISQAVINIRSSKLPDPKTLGNAGSFFKNPLVALAHYAELKKEYPMIPGFPIDEATVKVPAGWLIEQSGWKGKSIGQCGVHVRQALVLVNYGGASGKEIYTLSQRIIDDIKLKFQIGLEREVNII